MKWGVLGVLLLFFMATETKAAPIYIKETIEPTEVERDSGILVPMRDLRMQDGLIEPKEPEPSVYYYGACRITFYCSCSQCCGAWAGGPTASGATPTAGWTVANGSLPFGTKVIIDGNTYCVEDRGVSGDQFDIFVDSHQEALDRGLYYSDVYIVEG